jgi:hypothetical protein
MSMHRIALGIALVACAAADAAEPAAAAKPVAAAKSAPAVTQKVPAKPLDLRIGEVRNYMMPDEYREALGAPDADKNTVVVQANQPLLPMKFERPVPGGIMAPFWALAHPLQSWRIFAPDLNAREAPPPNVVPPPIFRWGP